MNRERYESMEKTVSLKKNAVFNILKQILKIAFPLITFPYVSRILLEENLGKYNFSLSIISYFALIAGLGVNSYAIRECSRIRSNKTECNRLANEIFTINLLSTAVSYVLLIFLCLNWKRLDGYYLLVGIQSLTIIFTTLGADWVNGIYEDYEYMTKRYVFVKIISLVFIFLMVKERDDYYVYTGIVVGSEVLANCMNIVYIRRYLKLKPTLKCNFRIHIIPLLVLFANAIAITVYSNADITMLGIFKDDSTVGIYSVSSKMYQIAKNLINAIIIVVIPRLSAILGTGDTVSYNNLLHKTLKNISVLMFPIITGMFMLSEECVYFLGGETFLSGSAAVKILSLALIPASINSVFFDGVLIANRKEKYCLIATVISALVNVVLNLFFIPKYSFYGAAVTTLIAETVGCCLAVYFARGSHRVGFKADKDIISILAGCVSIIFVCMIFKNIGNMILRSFISVLCSMIGYGIIMIIAKNTAVMSLLYSVKRKKNSSERKTK